MKKSTSETILVTGVFFTTLFLYLSWQSYFFNFDGIACAVAVELSDFKHLVHGNHLAYGVLAWIFDRSWRILGYRGQAIIPMQMLSAILGALGAATVASIFKRSGKSNRESALGACALAVSYAWWFWSLEAQVYMLGALFASLAAREALGNKPRSALVGLWHAAAVLGHVGHLMALPAFVWLLTRKKTKETLLSYLCSLLSVLALSYTAAALLAVRPSSLNDLKLWLLGSAALGVDRSFTWHSSSPMHALQSWLTMTIKIFASGQKVLSLMIASVPLILVAISARRPSPPVKFWLLWLAGYAVLFLSWEPFTIVYR
jgi:hypothetical protein